MGSWASNLILILIVLIGSWASNMFVIVLIEFGPVTVNDCDSVD